MMEPASLVIGPVPPAGPARLGDPMIGPVRRRCEWAESDYLIEFSEFPQTLARGRWAGRIVHLTPAALRIESDEPVAPGTLLRLLAYLPPDPWGDPDRADGSPARLLGKVVRVEPRGASLCELGVALLTGTGDHDALVALCHRLPREEFLEGIAL